MSLIRSDEILTGILKDRCKGLEAALGAEVILIRAPMQMGVDDAVRREIERLAADAARSDTLAVVLETSGGSVEVVERLSDVFRHHFVTVKFIIPNFAYSAGRS
jgi:hypothetical protein